MIRVFLIFGLLLGLYACSSNEEVEEGVTEREVYERAQDALDSGNWMTAIDALHLLEENFPFGTYGEQAQLELIYANFQAGEYEAVLTAADRFIRLHPQHRNVDYAYYMRALATAMQDENFLGELLGVDATRRDTSAEQESFAQFAQFLNRFPSSVYAPDARKRMIHQRNLLARHQIHVANYYFRRKAYLAAANRGRYVVENFQQTPAVPDGLAVMAQGYYLMGLEDLAADAAAVLRMNYPEHPALNENGEFNYQFSDEGEDRGLLSYLTFGLFDKDEPRTFDTREMYNESFQEDVEAPRPKHGD